MQSTCYSYHPQYGLLAANTHSHAMGYLHNSDRRLRLLVDEARRLLHCINRENAAYGFNGCDLFFPAIVAALATRELNSATLPTAASVPHHTLHGFFKSDLPLAFDYVQQGRIASAIAMEYGTDTRSGNSIKLVRHVVNFLAEAHKTNFNPNQPRAPHGQPDGGQWVDGVGNGGGGGGDGGGHGSSGGDNSHGGHEGDAEDNNRNRDSLAGQIGFILQNLLGIPAAHAEESGGSSILSNQPPPGKDPGPVPVLLKNGQPAIYRGQPFTGVDGKPVTNGMPLYMPNGVSLQNNAELGKKLGFLPSIFTPGFTLPTPVPAPNSLPIREAAMVVLFAPGSHYMDYQRIYSDTSRINPTYINFGNYNFGVVAAAADYELNQVLFAAGLANLWGQGNHTGPMFNNPANMPWIRQGFMDYTQGLIKAK